jgi:hypothetical protein
MNPILMLLMMQPHGGKAPPGATMVAIGAIYAVAWSFALVLMCGMTGLLVGWPCTIALCLAVGWVMESLKISPEDFALFMMGVVLLSALVAMGLFSFL